MKSVTLVCMEKDRDSTIKALGAVGVLHLTPVREPQSDDLAHAQRDLKRTQNALAFLESLPPEPDGPEPDDAGGPEPDAPKALLEAVESLAASRHELAERSEALRNERDGLSHYGHFDVALVRELQARGLAVGLYRGPVRGELAVPEGALAVVTGSDNTGRYFAVIGQGDVSVPDAVACPLPPRSLGEVEAAMENTAREKEACENRIRRLAAHAVPVLQSKRTGLQARVEALEVRESMGLEASLAYVHGFCPVPRLDTLRASARSHGWGLLIDDPPPDVRVPTLIESPAWVRPIESVFSAIQILPGYREADVSSAFFIFLSIFFAMIIGDAGYGLLFLAVTALARRAWPKAPPAPFRLMTIFGACTVLWGVATGAYFGVTALPAPLARFRIDWLTKNENIMSLCLLLGAIHLSIAHFWRAFRMLNSVRALAQAGWIAIVWAMFFASRTLLLNEPFPAWYLPVAGASLLAVVLFMTPPARLKSEWIHHAMLPLNLMSSFGDILSYLRLFALGVATVKLAEAFNTIVTGMIGFRGVLTGLTCVLLLFAGHAVNIGLGLMSVLVHGIRLNALEFSMHMGLEWSGIPYAPFVHRRHGLPEGAVGDGLYTPQHMD
ncbi:MAG: hypothetical protein JW951_01105 [Lentisphaerae bacterium]|nr:hypothetical protein [Lentisphaerota bacterium]